MVTPTLNLSARLTRRIRTVRDQTGRTVAVMRPARPIPPPVVPTLVRATDEIQAAVARISAYSDFLAERGLTEEFRLWNQRRTAEGRFPRFRRQP